MTSTAPDVHELLQSFSNLDPEEQLKVLQTLPDASLSKLQGKSGSKKRKNSPSKKQKTEEPGEAPEVVVHKSFKYLVCVDGSEHSQAVIEHLSVLLNDEDRLIIYSAFLTPQDMVRDDFSVDTDSVDYKREVEERRKEHQQVVDEVMESLSNTTKINLSNVEAIVEAVEDVKSSILEFAKTRGVDTIVVGNKGPDLTSYILGSVASYIVQNATCSVLVVR